MWRKRDHSRCARCVEVCSSVFAVDAAACRAFRRPSIRAPPLLVVSSAGISLLGKRQE